MENKERNLYCNQPYHFFRLPLRRTLLRLVSLLSIFVASMVYSKSLAAQNFYSPGHPFIQYTGRIDFTNPALPRFWQPGVYIRIKFKGERCRVIINDELLWGNKHNYLEIVIDGKAKRVQTKTAHDTIVVAENLSNREHELLICKNTEANIGYVELAGILCDELLQPGPKPVRKIECIGNSITCGTGSDQSAIPCGKGVWEDQHNAWMSYGAVTARALKAQYHLSAVSGIGLMHSCCNMDIIMPSVFDKISMRSDTIGWDFKNYQPDVVTVCLGQNDGIQDSAVFCSNYIAFIKQLRSYYPKTMIVCLTSPMADKALTVFMKKTLRSIVKKMHKTGDKNVRQYFFSRSYNSGCDSHPDMAEQQVIAKELTGFIKQLMKW